MSIECRLPLGYPPRAKIGATVISPTADLSLALSSYDPAIQVKFLDDMSRKIVSDFVEAIELVLNEVSERLTDLLPPLWNVHTRGGVGMSLHVLEEGLQTQTCPPGTKVTRAIL